MIGKSSTSPFLSYNKAPKNRGGKHTRGRRSYYLYLHELYLIFKGGFDTINEVNCGVIDKRSESWGG